MEKEIIKNRKSRKNLVPKQKSLRIRNSNDVDAAIEEFFQEDGFMGLLEAYCRVNGINFSDIFKDTEISRKIEKLTGFKFYQ